ncbi:hypothetical protein ACFV4M_40225, partial [Kitasatospora indigofera]
SPFRGLCFFFIIPRWVFDLGRLGGRVGAGGRPGRRTIDLTADEDTVTLPRLDSLEQKLKDLEQQFG